MQQQIHCISYTDKRFLSRTNFFIQEATQFDKFDSIKVYGVNDLDDNFKEKFNNVLQLDRGAGYWIWKCQIIKQHLSTLQDDSILFYIDAGCSFNNRTEACETFIKYIDIINTHSFLRFTTNLPEIQWTNHFCLNFFSKKYNIPYKTLAETDQLIATVIGVKKNLLCIQFLEEYIKCLEQDSNLITDHYNEIEKNIEFRDHRHDQSLFSLLHKSYGYNFSLPNHTWPANIYENPSSPILATRRTI
jgi:hypothetical protein